MADVIDKWIQQLRDSDVTRRRAAIRQLEMLGDPAALGPLAAIFALDPDLETRKLAQGAGKSIYRAIERRAIGEAEAMVSDQERAKAAEILAKAQKKKSK